MDHNATSLLLVIGHGLLRAGLEALLQHEPGFVVVQSFASSPEAMDWMKTNSVDLLVVDAGLSEPGALDLVAWSRQARPETGMLLISAHREDQLALHALRAGAHGYLNRLADAAQFRLALGRVRTGQRFVSPEVAASLSLGHAPGDRSHGVPRKLSDREFEVLRCIALGRSQTLIAQDMGVSPKTISTYRSRVLEKLGLKSNADITRYAVDHGLVE